MSTFTEFFDEWASTYDATVYGTDNEYVEVFENYEGILDTIAKLLNSNNASKVLEVGPGTGNLTTKLNTAGFDVIGIEPSTEMRKLAKEKLPDIEFIEGHFLSFPDIGPVDAIVSSYAFHHLTLEEKKQSIIMMKSLLNDNGQIVIADTMFESSDYKENLLSHVEKTDASNLLNDLNTEYYEMLDDIVSLLSECGFEVQEEKMNRYVWVVTGKKS